MDGIVIGQINFDISVDGFLTSMLEHKESHIPPVRMNTGGDAQNASTAMAYLGMDVCLIGRVGKDPAGDFCLKATSATGVDCSHVSRIENGHTGTHVALIRQGGGAGNYLFNAGENARLSVEDIDFSLFADAKFVSLHSLFALPGLSVQTVLERAHAHGAFTFADTTNVHASDSIDSISHLLPLLDVFAPSQSEISLLLRMSEPAEMIQKMLSLGVKNAVIKLGGDGCMIGDAQGVEHVPGYPSKEVDTLGAGDNFSAAFLYAKAKGYPLRRCAQLANAAGAITVASLGANGAVRSIGQLEEFIRKAQG
ncbi:carbohydrate kinase family protein [Ruminococcaceae bacterium OttesenSCG-928-I18]|nr:carbohydrate kinase family protein [Ruminococcaceae bacterium OttesenSCG-928-I18]